MYRRVCRKCGRVARVGSVYCGKCETVWRTPEYLQARTWILAHAPEWCGICLEGARDGDPWTVDHITARIDGGSNEWWNLRRAHRSCNSARGAQQQRPRRDSAGPGPIDSSRDWLASMEE